MDIWFQEEIPNETHFKANGDRFPPDRNEHAINMNIISNSLFAIYKSENHNFLVYYLEDDMIRVIWLMFEKISDGIIMEKLNRIEDGYRPTTQSIGDEIHWQIEYLSKNINFISSVSDNQWKTKVIYNSLGYHIQDFNFLYFYMKNRYMPLTRKACGVRDIYMIFDETVLGIHPQNIKIVSIMN